MDVWSRTYFPTNLALALLVTTDQPPGQPAQLPAVAARHRARHAQRDHLDAPARRQRALHRLVPHARGAKERVLYTGFYMTEQRARCRRRASRSCSRCRTATRRSCCDPRSATTARSSSTRAASSFGDAGFYRVQARDADRVRVWQIKTLKELFSRLRRRRGRAALRPRGALPRPARAPRFTTRSFEAPELRLDAGGHRNRLAWMSQRLAALGTRAVRVGDTGTRRGGRGPATAGCPRSRSSTRRRRSSSSSRWASAR